MNWIGPVVPWLLSGTALKEVPLVSRSGVDMAERIYYLQMQERDKVRRFVMRWPDRLLYSTDFVVGEFDGREHDIEKECLRLDEVYRADYKYFATDQAMYDWKVGSEFCGLALPKNVLKKIFFENARKWYSGI